MDYTISEPAQSNFYFSSLLKVCAYSAAEAQRVTYWASPNTGFPLAPARHLFLANRQRSRFSNGFSARLQQSTDETDEQDAPQSNGSTARSGSNSAGGIGVVNGNGGDDSESPGDNSIDDNQNDINQSTKTGRKNGGIVKKLKILKSYF